jgi:SAM-dependent methyltransferase
MSLIRQPGRVVRAVGRRVPRRPFRVLMPLWLWRPLSRLWLSVLRADPDKRRAARELLVTYDDVYRELDLAAIAYEGGVHPKHRLTGYHDFFVERVRPGERVLDIGSGKGELAHDLVVRSSATVVGVDHDPSQLEFRAGDVLRDLPDEHFDIVVMSNVLEHLGPRVDFLRRVTSSSTPRALLIRVPLYERDWTVPLKAELGLRAYWDPDHETEYDEDSFRSELGEAGLDVPELLVRWGEIWAVATPR